MQTIKTCSLDNGKQHVCFDDLKNYWKKDEFFEGLNPAETAQIRQNLGMPVNMSVDSSLDIQSKNPVQNRIITKYLQNKPDINSLAKVALTGQYSDLRNKPCTLPNPTSILINGLDSQGKASQWRYDGEESVYVDLNTKLSNFENDNNFVDKDALNTAITLKGIIVNGKILATDCDKFVTIEIPTKVSDLVQDVNYAKMSDMLQYATRASLNDYYTKTQANNKFITTDQLDSEIDVNASSSQAPSTLAVYNLFLSLQTQINRLSTTIAGLEGRITALERRV